MVRIPSQARRRDSGSRSIAVVAATLTAALVVAFAMAGPAAVRAADPLSAVPEEPDATVLDGVVYGAQVVDVDGDGINELVTIAPSLVNGAQLAVALWRQAANGSWFTTGQAALRRKVSPDEKLSAVPHPDANDTLALGVGDAARLLAWHDGARTDVLVAVDSGSGFNGAPPCCVTVYRVSADPVSGAPVLSMVANTGRGAQDVFVADLDGDGVDELVIVEPAAPATPTQMRVTVLHWDGSRFTGSPSSGGSVVVSENAPLNVQAWIIGDSDGVPGVEIGLVGAAVPSGGECPETASNLTRIALRDATLIQESVCLPFQGAPLAVPDALVNGGTAIFYGNDEKPVSIIAWPAGSVARIVPQSSSQRSGWPLAVLGSSSNPWVVLRRTASSVPVIELNRPDLSLVAAHGIAASPAAAHFVDSPLTPYVGPWPATSAGPAGFLFAGTLLEPVSAGQPASRQVAMLAGAAPVGSVGKHGAEIALLHTLGPDDLVQPEAMDPRGGPIRRAQAPALASIVPLASVLTPESGGGVLSPPLVDAIPDRAGAGDDNAILVGSRTFGLVVTTPPGTVDLTVANGAGQLAVLGADIPGQRPLLGGGSGPPFRVTVTAPSAGSGHFPADVFLVTPAGHGYRASFSVRVVTGAPALSVSTSVFSLGLDATVSGRTDPDTQVVVDGSQATVSADGSFHASVSAGLTPREVTVMATDPFGHVASQQVSVVAPLDYRQLPWIPIIVVLTVAAGAVLFLRAPRPTAHRGEASVDEGVFEEVDPD